MRNLRDEAPVTREEAEGIAAAAVSRALSAMAGSGTVLAAMLGSGRLVLPVRTTPLDAGLAADGEPAIYHDAAAGKTYLQVFDRQRGTGGEIVQMELTP